MTSAFTPIDESLKPSTNEDQARRAYFFCREIEARCQLAVIDDLQHMLSSVAEGEQPPPPDWAKAHKLLSCSLVYCTAIECGGTACADWLVDFFFTAMRLADEIDQHPLGRQMIERLGSYEKPYLLKQVGKEIAASIAGLDEEAASQLILDYGMESTHDRLALLQMSLSVPVEHLADLLSMIDAT